MDVDNRQEIIHKSRISRGDQVSGVLFALPWMLGLLIFFAYPLLSSIYFSLTDFNGQTVNAFVGFRNFTNLFADRDGTFIIAIRNTLVYTAMAVPSVIILGLCLALVMNIKSKVQGIYRVLAFLPTLVPAVATGVIWQWLLRPQLEEPNPGYPGIGFYNMVGSRFRTHYSAGGSSRCAGGLLRSSRS
jgi:multiple sugar transport system permease protein